MAEKSILIIGAGAAGLAAAERLSQHGFDITILEARDRIGGRIHTIIAQQSSVPVELGAEFVHGERNATWELIRAAKLPTTRVSDEHWRVIGGEWEEGSKDWDELSELTEQIELNSPDEDFQSFLNRAGNLDDKTKWLAKEYVEGFHAANPARMSAHAFKKAEDAAEKAGERQFRIAKGYSELIGRLVSQLSGGNVRLLNNALVKTIRWQPGHVEVEAQTPAGLNVYHADAAVVTVPLGVLKRREIIFEPELPEKEEAIDGLETGLVVKISLQFRTRFWKRDFGFVHSDEKWFPTWWPQESASILTGWGGGPRAETLSKEHPQTVEIEAIRALARLFKLEPKRIQDLLIRTYTYDWSNDPFSHGAYSYTPVGMSGMPNRLAAPVAQTIYLAGEVTDGEGNQGTVHAAVASGRRVAKLICKSVKAVTV